ncbi:hypothetical protein GF412_04655 [Candidatus Micrarchaeota archaeon]|nr:hypothetical protein [Candidatus Micrarchaeota archaeon]MBD3418243.1 hypothetical protein [Candidatus Micrarchaeota archaeon]
MAPTRPLAHATRESRGVTPIPGTPMQHAPPQNVDRGKCFSSHKNLLESSVAARKRSELSNLTVVNTRNGGSELPSGPDEDSRRIALPTFDEAIVNIETGKDGEAIWAIREAMPRILEFLNKKDLWDVVDALSVGALDEKGKKSPEIRAACLDLMVLVHKEILKKSLKQEKATWKKIKGSAEEDGGAQEGLPLLDPRAVHEAVEDRVTDYSMGVDKDFLEIEERMAITILSLMESSEPWIRDSAEKASCEIDSPILIRGLSGKLDSGDSAKDVCSALDNAGDSGEVFAALELLEAKRDKLSHRKLWKAMDALCNLAERRDMEDEGRAAAFRAMVPLYGVISRFGSNGRKGGKTEEKMAAVLTKAALGSDMEDWISEAAMDAVEGIDCEILDRFFLSGQIEEKGEGIDDTLERKTLDVELAKIIETLDGSA